jgi:endogenous inhibitor of DNA gyrase (YacG/DUF329 family)
MSGQNAAPVYNTPRPIQNSAPVYNIQRPRQYSVPFYKKPAIVLSLVLLVVCLIITVYYLTKSDVGVMVPNVGVLPTETIVSCDASQDKIGGVCYAKCPDGLIREGTICIVPVKTCANDEHLYKDICVKNSKLVHLGEWTSNKTITEFDKSIPTIEEAKSFASLNNYDTFVFNERTKTSGFGGKLGYNSSKKVGGWQVYGLPCADDEHRYKDTCVKNSELVPLGEWTSNTTITKFDKSIPTIEEAKSFASLNNYDTFVFNERTKTSGFGGRLGYNSSKKVGGWQVYGKPFT